MTQPRISISDFIEPPGSPQGWHSAVANPQSWHMLKTADVIFGFDPFTKNEFLVFGRDALKAVVKFSEPQALKTLVIELDQSGDELEYLLALLQTQRGQHDYEASE